MSNTFFSIIIPVYKVNENYLKECIESILAQTYRDFELIIVDDGSPDHCGDICDRYAETDSRIIVIHKKNEGVSVARNTGISKACGDWILFVDADDWIEPCTLEVLANQLFKKEYDMLIFHGVNNYIDKTVEIKYALQENYRYDLNQFEEKELFYNMVMRVPNASGRKSGQIYYSWDKAYRRTFLMENQLSFVPGLAKSEDKLFVACCFEKAKSIYHIADVLYHYRMNEESVCHRYSANMDQQRCILAEKLKIIAVRMDNELGEMCSNSSYHKILSAYERFMFGIVSDVLLLQYYHKDNPHKKHRRREALKFLHAEPFSTAIKNVSYKSLSMSGKLKKFMLRFNMVSLFCLMKKLEKA